MERYLDQMLRYSCSLVISLVLRIKLAIEVDQAACGWLRTRKRNIADRQSFVIDVGTNVEKHKLGDSFFGLSFLL